jgi:hypothetical protein
MDVELTTITKLLATLPVPIASDISLSNIVYDMNGSVNQNATLDTILPDNVAGVRITKVSDSSTSTSTSMSIALTAVPTALSYNLEYRFDSYVMGSLTSVYSAPVLLSFTTGKSNASVPVITSKEYVDASTFTVTYTSTNDSYTSANMILLSTVIANALSFGDNDGSVNLSLLLGQLVSMVISNLFTAIYTFGAESGNTNQTVNSAAASFYVAANPAIVDSVAVQSTPNTVTFDVNNNGAPHINSMLVAVAQDAGINEGDQGTFAIAMFSDSLGFVLNIPQANTLAGGPAHTLTVTAITGSGYDKVTTFSFQSATDLTTAAVNVILWVANAVEGADSFSTANVQPS